MSDQSLVRLTHVLLGLLLVLTLATCVASTARASEVIYNRYDVEIALQEAAATYGVSEATLTRVVRCEAQMQPYAVGDNGHSFGIAQLNDRPTGLLWHFYAIHYTDPFNPYEAASYMGRVWSGEFARQGIGPWRWSCR
jgi:hypothetical protein